MSDDLRSGLEVTRTLANASASDADANMAQTQQLDSGKLELELGLDATMVGSDIEQTWQQDPSDPQIRPLRGPDETPTEAKFGRHLLIGTLGAGGMGTVYSAYDPELDRKLAIKVLLSRGSEVESARLLREAQAMARLNHPHVVAVHDVGYTGSDVFVAMEYVDGGTLREWLEAETRTVDERVALLTRLSHIDWRGPKLLIPNASSSPSQSSQAESLHSTPEAKPGTGGNTSSLRITRGYSFSGHSSPEGLTANGRGARGTNSHVPGSPSPSPSPSPGSPSPSPGSPSPGSPSPSSGSIFGLCGAFVGRAFVRVGIEGGV